MGIRNNFMASSKIADAVLGRVLHPRFKRESRKFGFILYESFYRPIIFFKAVYRQLLVLFVMFFVGAAIFSHYNALPPIPAFLASVSTVTTLGLYVPNNVFVIGGNTQEAILLIFLIIGSVGIGASIVQGLVNTAVDTALAKGQATQHLISKLKNHTIVFGYNLLGRYVVEKLEELGLDYVVITNDNDVYNDLLSRKVLAVFESGFQPIESLKDAGIERASFIVSAHQNDQDNMVFVLSARKMRPDIRIITVVHDALLMDTAKNAGADVVIPSWVTVGHLLGLSTVTKDLVGVVFSEKLGTKEIAQFSIFASSPLIGQHLEEVANYASIIGVIRGGSVVQNIFIPNFTIQENDTLLVMGDPVQLEMLEKKAKAT